MSDPVQTVTTPAPSAAKAALAAAASAATQTVVKNVKSDVKSVGVARPWVLLGGGGGIGAIAALLIEHFIRSIF